MPHMASAIGTWAVHEGLLEPFPGPHGLRKQQLHRSCDPIISAIVVSYTKIVLLVQSTSTTRKPGAIHLDIRYQPVMSNPRCAETETKSKSRAKPDALQRQADTLPPCSSHDRNKQTETRRG